MILTPKIVARLIVVGLFGVLLQLTFFSQVELFHVSPDVLPALVVSFGLLGGTMTGAVSGFAIGFLLDCLLIQPIGGASLVLIAVGYAAGTFRERFEIHSRLVAPLMCAILTLLAELGFGLDLSACAVTGQTTDLTHVSPKTGRAVSREPAKPYCDRLLRLPQFLISGAEAGPGDIADAFRLTGHFLHMHVWEPRQVEPPSVRDALIADLTDRL